MENRRDEGREIFPSLQLVREAAEETGGDVEEVVERTDGEKESGIAAEATPEGPVDGEEKEVGGGAEEVGGGADEDGEGAEEVGGGAEEDGGGAEEDGGGAEEDGGGAEEDGGARKKKRMGNQDKSNKRKNEEVKRGMGAVIKNLKRMEKDNAGRFKYRLEAEYRTHGRDEQKLYKEGGLAPPEFSQQLRTVVHEAVASAIPSTSRGLRTPQKTAPTLPVLPSPAKSSDDQSAPQTSACSRKVCTFAKTLRSNAVWVGCDWKDPVTNKKCDYWVHSKCLGYPTATEEYVAEMPPFYCPIHLLNFQN